MQTTGFLGIDVGTQGLSVIFTDEAMNLVDSGEGSYEMVPHLEMGCYEQFPADWERALQVAMQDLHQKLFKRGMELQVLAIGISGQMHGEVMVGPSSHTPPPARLWCDSRNETEAEELTQLLGVKMPKRITAARWLWSLRNRPELTAQTQHLTTPGGWLAHRLTGEWNLGIGDASGMFPIDPETFDFSVPLLELFDRHATSKASHPANGASLRSLLPTVRRAGESGGVLDAHGASLLSLPSGTPVAPAEGDQPAALAGSLIGSAGTVSMSFGTSVCANSVGDRAFQGVSRGIDHFCAADGKPINMVWLRNGTTFMNSIIQMFGSVNGDESQDAFATLIPQIVDAPHDCGGLLALPFMDDEPGLGVHRGGTAMLIGLNESNATPGNVGKAALLATIFNLKLGSRELESQGFPLQEIVLSGGLTKSPQLGQILADAFDMPVRMLNSATEGSAWGAALTAKYRFLVAGGETQAWQDFLEQHNSGNATTFTPEATAAREYQEVYERYLRLIAIHAQLDQAISTNGT